MDRRLTYLEMMIKKGMKTIPLFVITFISSAILIAISLLTISSVISDNQIFNKIKVAICIPEDNYTADIAAQLISNFKSVKSICDIEYMDEQTAIDRLHDGNIQAVIVTSEEMIEDINTGINTPIEMLISSDIFSGENAIFKELVMDGVSLIRTTEAAVYAADDMTYIYKGSMSIAQVENTINDICLSYVINRKGLYVTTLLSAYGDISIRQYYVICAMLFIISLFGLGFASMYDKRSKAVAKSLNRIGIGAITRSISDIIAMTIPIWICIVIMICIASHIAGIMISIYMIFALFIISLSEASFIHAIYAITRSSGSLIYLCICILMAVISGGFIPVAYMPSGIDKVSSFLPLTYWQRYLADILFHSNNDVILPIFLGLIIFIIIGIYGEIRHER